MGVPPGFLFCFHVGERDENELTGLLTKDFFRRAGKIEVFKFTKPMLNFRYFRGPELSDAFRSR